MAFLKYQAGMPASTGVASARLLPPSPWHALHANAFVYPGASSGPAAATPAPSISATPTAALSSFFLTKDVIPDVGGPGDGVIGVDGRRAGRELLLDLAALAV